MWTSGHTPARLVTLERMCRRLSSHRYGSIFIQLSQILTCRCTQGISASICGMTNIVLPTFREVATPAAFWAQTDRKAAEPREKFCIVNLRIGSYKYPGFPHDSVPSRRTCGHDQVSPRDSLFFISPRCLEKSGFLPSRQWMALDLPENCGWGPQLWDSGETIWR